MKRKILTSLLLVVALLLTALPVHAGDVPRLKEKILESYYYETEVDVTECNVTEEELQDAHTALYDACELPWYAAGTYEYTYDVDTKQVFTFTPHCLEEEEYDRALYERRLAEILNSAVFEGMSQWQMCLSIHDTLVSQSRYDESQTMNYGYDLLIRGSAMCRGYAEAYKELLSRVGIPCEIVVSEEMDHVWNLVCIDDNWYHVDVTWADPYPDIYGYVSHEYFLVTDEEISAGEDPHYGWETERTCTDQSYMDAFWKGVDSRICYPNDMTSYLIREDEGTNYIRSRDEVTGEETLLYTVELDYIDIGAGEYGYPHRGLSLWDGRLWFSDMDTVYSMNPDGSDLVEEFAYDAEGNGMHIYGCYVENDTIYLILRSHDEERSTLEQPLEPSGYHVHSYTEEKIDATCQENGMTVYTCSCGLQVECDPVSTVGHDYQVVEEEAATLFEAGYIVYACSYCDDSYTETITQLELFNGGSNDGLHTAMYIGAAILLVVILLKKGKK